MNEIWKDIEGYEGLYQVSNKGRVRSLDRMTHNGHKIRGRMLKLGFDNNYYFVVLCKNGKTKPMTVHRLVAKAFVENPNGKPFINHKDENKTNNVSENLEWVTPKENLDYSNVVGKMKRASVENNNRRVGMYYNGRLLRIFKSMTIAAKSIHDYQQNVSKSCHSDGRYTCKGFSFKLLDNRKVENKPKAVASYTADGELLKRFDCINDAAMFYNVSRSNIVESCNRENRKCRGLIFKYL